MEVYSYAYSVVLGISVFVIVIVFQLNGSPCEVLYKRCHDIFQNTYSRFIEISKPTTGEVVTHLSSIFARHRILEMLVSDNGTQYLREFAEFAEE